MNPALQFIFSRRSIRSFTEQAVSDELVEDLLQAAMAAPSAKKKDPWHFLVIRDRQRLRAMARIQPYGRMLRQAPLGILVCGDIELALDQELSFMLQDLSAAMENLLLAANVLGLGACWVGVHPRKERMSGLAELFGLPERIIPVAAVALGWPAKTAEARTRYNPARVHREEWTETSAGGS
ncbi:nitroreductase family protein [Desulfogranum mediterraneum]|uniref:nitroreductase family protein n=1 Tax=Desulfogranum mediterraneum TaxID=160661 RepID=UPI00040A865D|nr:nitroreductase family protein [Desulfogranum mediterraneum]